MKVHPAPFLDASSAWRCLHRVLVNGVILSVVACGHGVNGTAASRSPTPPSVGDWIDDYVGMLEKGRPEAERFSGFVGVARAGQWEVQRGYRADESLPLPTPDTRFRIGSVSKQFTAVAILKLREQGLLELTDPIGKYVPDLSPAVSAARLDHLLSQRSGIADFTSDDTLMSEWMKPHRVSDVLSTFAHVPLRFPPGTVFEYSNTNYFLLGLVVERLTGDLDGYLREHVFRPAGMTRSSTLAAPRLPNTARGYTAGASGSLAAVPQDDPLLVLGGGMVLSTGNDLLAWHRALERHSVLSASSQAELLTPHVTAVPDSLKQELPSFRGYAFGVNVFCSHQREVQSHNGAVAGFTSYFARVPDEGWVIVVLSNSDRFSAPDLGKPLVEMLLTSKPAKIGTNTVRPCSAGS